MLKTFYHLLAYPPLYRLSQFLFAPGAEKLLTRKIRETSTKWQVSGTLLDVGCGPSSWLWKINMKPVGVDISFLYSQAYHQTGEIAVTGSATELPFANSAFDGVWTIGVLHHLPATEASLMILEMQRVCKPGGYVAVFDAVLPCSPWRRPMAYLVRKLDRGKFMRTQTELEDLLLQRSSWSINRFTYAINGLEMLLCLHKKAAQPTSRPQRPQ